MSLRICLLVPVNYKVPSNIPVAQSAVAYIVLSVSCRYSVRYRAYGPCGLPFQPDESSLPLLQHPLCYRPVILAGGWRASLSLAIFLSTSRGCVVKVPRFLQFLVNDQIPRWPSWGWVFVPVRYFRGERWLVLFHLLTHSSITIWWWLRDVFFIT